MSYEFERALRHAQNDAQSLRSRLSEAGSEAQTASRRSQEWEHRCQGYAQELDGVSGERDNALQRVGEVEAQCAALREALEPLQWTYQAYGPGHPWCMKCPACGVWRERDGDHAKTCRTMQALASDAGAAMLAELGRLRANATSLQAAMASAVKVPAPAYMIGRRGEPHFRGSPEPEHVCATCAEWGDSHWACQPGAVGQCNVISHLQHPCYPRPHRLNELVRTPADFPGCGKWLPREEER